MKTLPIDSGVSAKHHTPLYLVHRYFARRPHNVFSHIVNHYLDSPMQIVLDPFAGGGVTLIEALSLGHRAIGYEINDLACFIIENELLDSKLTDFLQLFQDSLNDTYQKVGYLYVFKKREVYWQAWDSFTRCPMCRINTFLSQDTKMGAGVYICNNCSHVFRPKLVHGKNISPHSIRVMDSGSMLNGQPVSTTMVNVSSEELQKREERLKQSFMNSAYYTPDTNKTPIPQCNLEKESALHKKGFHFFEDFFPFKAQAWIIAFAESIMKRASDDKDVSLALYLLSASLRYISRFSTINTSWRGDSQPLEWAKSNFWTPYSFVELNPFIAIWDRYRAYERALEDVRSRFKNRSPRKGSVNSTLLMKSEYSIINKSSEKMPEIPDNSIDLILTDPPYGSYLHYSELTCFWTCWLRKFNDRFSGSEPLKVGEAVPGRKRGYPGYKSFGDYEQILARVFSECYRVLKYGRYCVITFNNKEPEAWIAFLRAIKRAGFMLPLGGVVFQDGVETYKRTIDLRREGAIHGDFIYSFKKDRKNPKCENQFDWRKVVRDVLVEVSNECTSISNTDLFTRLNFAVIPKLYSGINPDSLIEDSILQDFSTRNLEKEIEVFLNRENGFWFPRN